MFIIPLKNQLIININPDKLRQTQSISQKMQSRFYEAGGRIISPEEARELTKEQWLKMPPHQPIWSGFIDGGGCRILTGRVMGPCPEDLRLTPWVHHGYPEPKDAKDDRDDIASERKRVKTSGAYSGGEATSGITVSVSNTDREDIDFVDAGRHLTPKCVKLGGPKRTSTVFTHQEMTLCSVHNCYEHLCPTVDLMCDEAQISEAQVDAFGSEYSCRDDIILVDASHQSAPICVKLGGMGRMQSVFKQDEMVVCAFHNCYDHMCPPVKLMCDEAPSAEVHIVAFGRVIKY